MGGRREHGDGYGSLMGYEVVLRGYIMISLLGVLFRSITGAVVFVSLVRLPCCGITRWCIRLDYVQHGSADNIKLCIHEALGLQSGRRFMCFAKGG